MKSDKPYWMPDTQGFLAIAILVLVGAIVFILLLHNSSMDDKTSAVLTTVIGMLLASLKDVYSFFFGSSKGSEKKDDALIAGSISPTSTPPIVPPAQPISVTDATKAVLSWAAVLILGSLLFMPSAFAQAKLKPLTGNIGNDLGLTNTAPGAIPSLDPLGLIKKIMALAGPDLTYAVAMANAANTTTSKIRVTCLTAIQTLNSQASGVGLKDAQGNALVEPSTPHIFTDLEQAAEGIDSLSPTGPLFTSCAGAAALAGMNVMAFINAVVTGTAAAAIVVPK